MSNKEPVPKKDNWKQELIKNKISPLDEERCNSIERIANEDKLLDIEEDNFLILIPKTEKRATDEDVTLSAVALQNIQFKKSTKICILVKKLGLEPQILS